MTYQLIGDFGGAAFTGEARWLQIATRCPTNIGGFTNLDPRQPLTSTPYALVAQTAVNAVNAWSLTGNAGTTAANFLGTTDNQPLEIRVNNVRALHLISTSGEPNAVIGASSNTIGAAAVGAVIAGGTSNTGSGSHSFVGGGAGNTADQTDAAVVGGTGNTASGTQSAVVGGSGNTTSGGGSVVLGATSGTASSLRAVVLGGSGNQATTGNNAAVVGGLTNKALNTNAGVFAGETNQVTEGDAVVVGGSNNTVSAFRSVIVGGAANMITGQSAGQNSAILAGVSNAASSQGSVVLGGFSNVASGNNSIVGGVSASSNGQSSTFVWSDGSTANPSGATFDATASNQFSVLATGGIRMFVGTPATGCSLTAANPTWVCTSDRALKANVQPIDGRDVLARLRSLPMQTYAMLAGDPGVRHLGPMAQDFYAAFGLGDSDRAIATIDLDGVSLAAIQALDTLVQEQDARAHQQDARIAALEQERDGLQARLDTLEARMAALEQTGPSQRAASRSALPAAGAALMALGIALALPRAYRLLTERADAAVQAQPARTERWKA